MNKYTLHITASGPGVNITATAEGQGLNLVDAMDNMKGIESTDVTREQMEACTEITMRVIKVPGKAVARRVPRRPR